MPAVDVSKYRSNISGSTGRHVVETQAQLDFAGQDSYSILFFLTHSGLNNNAPTYIEQLVQLQR